MGWVDGFGAVTESVQAGRQADTDTRTHKWIYSRSTACIDPSNPTMHILILTHQVRVRLPPGAHHADDQPARDDGRRRSPVWHVALLLRGLGLGQDWIWAS